MSRSQQFYVDGHWVDPVEATALDVVNPATGLPVCAISLGSAQDVDRAVASARRAFPAYAALSPADRRQILLRIAAAYDRRAADMATAISLEMGAPMGLCNMAHVPAGRAHIGLMIEALESYPFEQALGAATIVREAIGVCGLITPWNWPINQVAAKVMPALAAGCAIILKPSEMAPLSAQLLAEIMDEAAVPAGVFNLVNGSGDIVGTRLANHPDIDMVSFTGSTRAGILVAKAAADTVKRVTQELGGKSANIILDDAAFDTAVISGITFMMFNSGQSCNAPSRMLVPASRAAELPALIRAACDKIVVGDPLADGTTMGPVANRAQWTKVQRLIQVGIDEGAVVAAGGPGKPVGSPDGFYVHPTVFTGVTNDMVIAREEIFGPVLCIMTYEDEEDAVRIANDSIYGLAAYVQGSDPARVRRIAGRLRAGNVYLNGAYPNAAVPFGGYKQSGNGREWGIAGLEEYLETKAVLGH